MCAQRESQETTLLAVMALEEIDEETDTSAERAIIDQRRCGDVLERCAGAVEHNDLIRRLAPWFLA